MHTAGDRRAHPVRHLPTVRLKSEDSGRGTPRYSSCDATVRSRGFFGVRGFGVREVRGRHGASRFDVPVPEATASWEVDERNDSGCVHGAYAAMLGTAEICIIVWEGGELTSTCPGVQHARAVPAARMLSRVQSARPASSGRSTHAVMPCMAGLTSPRPRPGMHLPAALRPIAPQTVILRSMRFRVHINRWDIANRNEQKPR